MNNLTKKKFIFSNRSFNWLFNVIFFAAMNDNIYKNALLILITFDGYEFLNLNRGFTINFAVFLFILPFFLFSSLAGKLSDFYDKAKLTRYIKLFEISLTLVILFAFYFKLTWLLLLNIFFLGVHSTFFGPIKYAIIPQYLDREQIVDGTAYVEFVTFIAIIIGQILGSWFIINHHVMLTGFILLGFSVLGYLSSLKMQSVTNVSHELGLYKNFIKDTYTTYAKIIKIPKIKGPVHFISWFWGFAAVLTTQLPLFCQKYINLNATYYLIMLSSFSISIGIGSVICAKLSKRNYNSKLGLLGLIGISIFGFMLLFINHHHITSIFPTIITSIYSLQFIFVIIICLLLGITSGFFSVTCYNEMQLKSPDNCRSQVFCVLNITNAFYMVVASLIAAILILFMNVWQLLALLFIVNCFVVWLYARYHQII